MEEKYFNAADCRSFFSFDFISVLFFECSCMLSHEWPVMHVLLYMHYRPKYIARICLPLSVSKVSVGQKSSCIDSSLISACNKYEKILNQKQDLEFKKQCKFFCHCAQSCLPFIIITMN